MCGCMMCKVYGCVTEPNNGKRNHNTERPCLFSKSAKNQGSCGTKAPATRSPAPQPPPAAPVIVCCLLIYTRWPTKPFNVGKRDVAVDSPELGSGTSCVKCRWGW